MWRWLIPTTTRHAFVESMAVSLLLHSLLFSFAAWRGIEFQYGGKAHDGHLEIAQNLSEGNGYAFHKDGPPVIHRPPVFPTMLSFIVRLPDGIERAALVVVNAAFVAGFAALAFYHAGFWFDPRIAPLASLFVIGNPWLHYVVKNPMAAPMQACLFGLWFTAAAELLVTRRVRSTAATWGLAVSLGVLGGLLVLCHGAMLLSYGIVLACLAVVACAQRHWSRLAALAVVPIVTVSMVLPWTYRNWQVTHRIIPVTANAGLAYFMGAARWDTADGSDPMPVQTLKMAGLDPQLVGGIEFYGCISNDLDLQLETLMKQDMREHPAMALRQTVLNGLDFYFPVSQSIYRSVVHDNTPRARVWIISGAISLFYGIQWILALVACFRCARARQYGFGIGMMLLAIFSFAAPYWPFIAFVGHSIYVFGTLPFLAALAACAFLPQPLPRSEIARPSGRVAVEVG